VTKTRLVFFIVLLITTLVFLVQMPVAELSRAYPQLPRLAHVVLFFVLAASLHIAFRLRIWINFALLMVYGAAIEFLHYQMPTRVFDPEDLIANAIGAFGFYALLGILKLTSRLRQN